VSSFDPRRLAEVDPKKISVEEFQTLLNAAAEQAGEPGAAAGLEAIDEGDFARLIGRARKDQLEAVMGSPLRPIVLDQIFRRFAEHYRTGEARPPKVIHWKVTGGPAGDADEYELVMRGDSCDTNAVPQHDADTTITLSGPDFLLLTSGNSKPTTMFMTGKLKVRGDLGLAAVLAKLFVIPTS
jgi:hypothetical protein